MDEKRCVWFHVPNGGRAAFAKNPAVARRHDYEFGTLAGVADLIFIWRNKFNETQVLCIEVKEPKGHMSDNQKTFCNSISANGGIYTIARSVKDAERIINEHEVPIKTA